MAQDLRVVRVDRVRPPIFEVPPVPSQIPHFLPSLCGLGSRVGALLHHFCELDLLGFREKSNFDVGLKGENDHRAASVGVDEEMAGVVSQGGGEEDAVGGLVAVAMSFLVGAIGGKVVVEAEGGLGVGGGRAVEADFLVVVPATGR